MVKYRCPYIFLISVVLSVFSEDVLAEEVSLLTRNPFTLGNSMKDANAEQPAIEKISSLENELEFCGSHTIGGVRKFSLLSKTNKRKYWMELSQSISGFTLVRYNEQDRCLLVEYEGKLDMLPLRLMSRSAAPNPYINQKRNKKRLKSQTRTSSGSNRRIRNIIPREERPPKVLPAVPEFPEKLPPVLQQV